MWTKCVLAENAVCVLDQQDTSKHTLTLAVKALCTIHNRDVKEGWGTGATKWVTGVTKWEVYPPIC